LEICGKRKNKAKRLAEKFEEAERDFREFELSNLS